MWNEIPGENKDWNKKIFEEIIAKHKFGEKIYKSSSWRVNG